jgi:hypothetical protein
MFADMTDINLKQLMFEQQMRQIEDDMVPFGFIDDGSEAISQYEDQENSRFNEWQLWKDDEY